MERKFKQGVKMSELQEHQASPELQKFFQNLLDLKDYIRTRKGQHFIMNEVYNRLDAIIKETK